MSCTSLRCANRVGGAVRICPGSESTCSSPSPFPRSHLVRQLELTGPFYVKCPTYICPMVVLCPDLTLQSTHTTTSSTYRDARYCAWHYGPCPESPPLGYSGATLKHGHCASAYWPQCTPCPSSPDKSVMDHLENLRKLISGETGTFLIINVFRPFVLFSRPFAFPKGRMFGLIRQALP